MMKMLELFCGSKNVTKAFQARGFECTTMDLDPRFNADLQLDVLTLPDDYFSGFDAIWASPPCSAFSVAVIGRNWYHDHSPKTDSARTGLAVLEKTIALIQHANPTIFWIENPRGKMRRMPIMQNFKRDTVTYCQYGDFRQKPTDIWHNTQWHPRPMCGRGDSCHVSAPRGSRTGTQGMASAYDKGIIPEDLANEIAEHAYNYLNGVSLVAQGQQQLFV